MGRTKHIAVIGGSVTGLAASLALSDAGHRVTVLEADDTPLPESPEAAFEKWDRRGAPQTRQSHAFLGRLYTLLRDRAPAVLEKLLAAGATELKFADRFPEIFPDAELKPGDDDIVFIACRRIVFEYVLRKHVLDTGRVDYRNGSEVVGLVSQRRQNGLPVVTGVRLKDDDGSEVTLDADIVVDASGRRSPIRRWLRELGTPEIREERSPCGIFYTTRFYRLREGVTPPDLEGGIAGVDLGYLKLGIFISDAGVFSMTLAASPADDDMRRVLKTPYFEAALEAVPKTKEWVDPAIAEPLSDVQGMAKLENVRRFFAEGGQPLALGVFPIGDAVIHSNPLTGRGCTLGFVGAFELARILEETGDDAMAAALAYEEMVERELVPWYRLQCAQDADAVAVAEAQRRGEDPYQVVRADGSNDPRAFARSMMRDGLRPALNENPEVLRTFMRLLNLLDPPANLMDNPMVVKAVTEAYMRRGEREVEYEGPSRREMVEVFERVSAEGVSSESVSSASA